MRTFKEYYERRIQEAAIQIPGKPAVPVSATDMDLFDKAQTNAAQIAKIDLTKPVADQMKNKSVQNRYMQAIKKDKNYGQIEDPAIKSMDNIQAMTIGLNAGQAPQP